MKNILLALLGAAVAGCQHQPTATAPTATAPTATAPTATAPTATAPTATAPTATAPTATAPTAPAPLPAAPPSAGAPTAAAARAAIGRYLQDQPNASLYAVDSARATDLGAYWQVLVPRTDWARRMPNRAAFEVDKQSGAVKSLLVK